MKLIYPLIVLFNLLFFAQCSRETFLTASEPLFLTKKTDKEKSSTLTFTIFSDAKVKSVKSILVGEVVVDYLEIKLLVPGETEQLLQWNLGDSKKLKVDLDYTGEMSLVFSERDLKNRWVSHDLTIQLVSGAKLNFNVELGKNIELIVNNN